jgi:tetratricopeptide (TPR) repeat protein
MDVGRAQEAKQLLSEALQASSHDPAYHLFFQAEEALYLNNDHRGRQKLLADGIKSAPNDAFLLRNLGGGYLVEERLGKARRFFDAAYKADPRDADTLRSLGLLFSIRGRESRAMNWFHQAIAAKPDDHDSMRQMGICYAKLGYDNEAINWYNRALGCNSHDYDAMRQMGISFAMTGQYETALDWLDRALEVNPNDMDSKRNKRLVILKQSGKGNSFLDRIMIRLARKVTLVWRRLLDRFDQALSARQL